MGSDRRPEVARTREARGATGLRERQELRDADAAENKASELDDAGKYTEAIQLEEQCLAIRGRLLGKTHPDYAVGLNSLGLFCLHLADYKRAEPLFKRALKIRKKRWAKHIPTTPEPE